MTTLSLAAILAEAARRYPDKVAVVDAGTRVTYHELWEQARSYASGLRELGVRPGDTVALLIPNVLDFPRAYFGALAAGAGTSSPPRRWASRSARCRWPSSTPTPGRPSAPRSPSTRRSSG